ncbi:MAG TPA: hypothetical protein ENH11_00960 [Candidatus Acetothermia bacterium]|nr:hypothetical protein [Candidatus Acetothermia bacterium]
MRKTIIFGEDYGHEVVAKTLLLRMAEAEDISIETSVRSCRGGYGRMMNELREFAEELKTGRHQLPDLLLVATDADCKGITARTQEVMSCVPEELHCFTSCMIPDPHVERWLLLDSRAFKSVLGCGCQAPDAKCERHRYKKLLREAVTNAGVTPQLGGLEYAEDLVRTMDMDKVAQLDTSFRKSVSGIRSFLMKWSMEER